MEIACVRVRTGVAGTLTQNGSTTNLPTLPDGWPIGSYDTHREAQRAVDHLADHEFAVQGITIVGIEPMLVERADGPAHLEASAGRPGGVGAWLGLFVGLFTAGAGVLPILICLVSGVGFGFASAGVRYGATKGQRDFVSHSQLLARRYDVLCQPRNAESGRDLLAALAMRTP
jgi:heat induced stress protein YflT